MPTTQTHARIRKPDPTPGHPVPSEHRILEVTRDIAAPPEQVMAVLRDGWLFASWVVGASHIRAVDEAWPLPGSNIHHAVGAWPLLVRDRTESLEYDPTGLLVMRARAWPFGEALVRLEVSRTADGCRVLIGERSLRGPAKLMRPIEPLLLAPRNMESLHRLAALAQGRAGAC